MVSTEVLRRQPVLRGGSEESLRQLAMVSGQRDYEAGAMLFHDGARADQFYVIARGEVDIRYTLNSGEQSTVDTLVAGDLVGWSAVVEPFRMTADCVARRETRVLEIDAVMLRELCESDVGLGYGVMLQVATVLSHRLQGARVQLATA
ncbi:MAG: cyclic nucleotide-binding domain-containing protein [bacterium]|nr:cyclic nucleotide-binding domain-containing protein [bacterium]